MTPPTAFESVAGEWLGKGGVPVEAWPTATQARIGGKPYLAFAGCDYLGLSHDPVVLSAYRDALYQFGAGANGSRVTSGNTKVHVELEAELGAWLGCEAAAVLPDGALANLAAAQVLAESYQAVWLAERAHPSLQAAVSAAGMRVRRFDPERLDELALQLRAEPGASLVVSDSVFAADGRRLDLEALVALLEQVGGALWLDDCHGLGVLGSRGGGAASLISSPKLPLLVTATLAKSLGCAGGVLAASAAVVRGVRERAWAYRTTTPISPALASAARVALGLLARDGTRLLQLRENVRSLSELCGRFGLTSPLAEVPIVAWALPEPRRDKLLAALGAAQIWLPLIDYPGAAVDRYFRVAVSAAHTADDFARLEQALAAGLEYPADSVRWPP